MIKPSPSHLGALTGGLRPFRSHPALILGLAIAGMVLAQLGPALELAAGAGPHPLVQPLFSFAGLLPLEMYLLPRLQIQLDAEALDLPGNPAADWRATFDRRWLPVFLARLGVTLATGLGLVAFILPGIAVLTLFGWTPTRMLLRGDAFLPALKWSQGAMARHWPRIVQAVLAMALVVLADLSATGWILEKVLPPFDPDLGPGALLRLKHPAFWITNLASGALNIWLSCALLDLYHRLEAALRDPLMA